MAGPWEKYQQDSSPKDGGDSGPWAKYQQPTTEAPGEIDAKIGGVQTGSTQPSAASGVVDAVLGNSYVQGAGNMAKKSALPIAGGIAGAGIGTALGGPVGTVIGESIGSGIGEATNQLMGVTEPSISEIALSMAAGPATRGVLLGLRKGLGTAINAFGGRQEVSDIATDVAKKMFGPKVPSEELLALTSNLQGHIPTYRTGKVVADILAQETGKPSPVSKSIVEALKDYDGYYKTTGLNTTAHDVQQMIVDIQDLRTASSLAFKAGNHRLGVALNTVRGGLLDDATASKVPELAQFGNAYRREMSLDKLSGILASPKPLTAFDKAVGKSAKDRLFATDFSPSEQGEIRTLIEKIMTVAPSGFSGVAGRTITGIAGASIPADPMTKTIMAVGGFMLPDLMARAISTKAGRGVVEKLLTDKAITPAALWTGMAQYAVSQNANDAQEGEIGDVIKDFLKGKNLSIEDKIKASMVGAKQGVASGLFQE